MERAHHGRVGRLHRPPQADATATPATSPSSSATTRAPPTWSSRPPTRRGRPTTPTAGPTSTAAARTVAPTRSSYNRPVITRGGDGRPRLLLLAEYPLVRFMERNGYDVSYIGRRRHRPARQPDQEPQGLPVRRPRRVLERCAARQRRGRPRRRRQPAVPQRQRGLLADPLRAVASTAASTAYRTLVTYKETWANAKIDPDPEWTGTWRDPRFAPPRQGGGKPENELTGTQYMVNFSELADQGERRRGQVPPVAQHLAGDHARAADAGARAPHRSATSPTRTSTTASGPAGLVRLSTTVGAPEYLTDFGNTSRRGRPRTT